MGLSNRFIIEDEIGTKYYPHTFAEITFLDDGTSVESAIGDIRNSINGLNTNLGSIQLTWDSVTGKPTTFTPATHTHTVAQVTGISYPVTSVAGKTGVVALAKADVALGNVENYGIATTAQAQAGASNGVYMTPLRVVETINAKASGLTVSKATYDSGGLNINTEITSLKSTVASGKTSVANAINGKTGKTLSNQNTFAEYATAINSITKATINYDTVATYFCKDTTDTGTWYRSLISDGATYTATQDVYLASQSGILTTVSGTVRTLVSKSTASNTLYFLASGAVVQETGSTYGTYVTAYTMDNVKSLLQDRGITLS